MPSENFYPPKSAGSGSGDVAGPASSTDNAVVRFDGTTGKIIQGSQVVVDDSGNLTTPGTVDGRDVSTDGATLDSHVANTSNPHATTKAQVGLGNVDNTSDANKPVSTAQAAADAAVQAFAIQRANHTGTQLASTISDFSTAATAAGTDVNTANTLVKRNANKGFAVSYTDLDPTAGDPAYAEGRLFYDNAAKTLAYYNNSSNVKLNIGQESYIRVANVTGSIIPNGTVVYITGSSAGLVTVAPAQANAVGTARAIGVTTEALPATTGVGYVTSYGVVNTLNTSGFAAGARLFLSAVTPGAFTDVAPTGTNYSTPVGFVGVVDATVGSIFVDGGVKGQIGRGSANQLRGMNAAATEEENKTLSGTTNEVGVTHGVGTITLGINGTVQTAKGGTSQTTVQGATAQYGGYIRSVKTANYTMVDADWVVANSTAGSFTLTLPTMTTGQRFKVTDGKRTWDTFPVTLAPPAGQSIAGQANGVTLVLNIKGGSVEGVYDGTTLSINSTGSTTFTSSSGSGEKNYVSSPNNSTGWTASAAGIAVTTETTRTLLPDNSTQQTGIKILRASATDYVFTRFTLDQADYNKKLKIQFDQAYAGTAADYTVEVYSNTLSTYAGTSTQLTVSADANIPSGTGQVQKTFDSSGSTAPYIEVRIRGNTGTTALYLNNFLVGPGVIGQVPAIGPAVTWTPTGSWVTNTTYTGKYWQRGPVTLYYAKLTLTGAPNAASLTVNMPTGQTISTADVDVTQYMNKFGSGQGFPASALATVQVTSSGNNSSVAVLYQNSTAGGQTVVNNTLPGVWASGNVLELWWEVPVAENANAGVLNSGAGAQVEYAYNTSTSDSNDTTSFGNGPQGQQMTGALTAQRAKTVRFSTPIQVDDLIQLEFSASASGPWTEVGTQVAAGAEIQPLLSQNTSTYGARVGRIAGQPATDVSVSFGQYRFASGGTFSAAGDAWSTAYFWRVRKVKASSPVGFGLATATDSGLVSTTTQTLAGNKTFTGTVRSSDLVSGRWTPTFTGLVNMGNPTSTSCIYSRNGNIVTCSGFVTVTPTTGGNASTSFRISLPITSTPTATSDVTGNFACLPAAGTAGASGFIIWSSGSNADVFFNASASGGQNGAFTFHYEIK